MYTIVETPTFKKDADNLWSADERGSFCAYLAANPEAGDVIAASGGCRKIRWNLDSKGKRGGVRVIYFTRHQNDELWLLVIYSKAVKENIPAHILKQIKEVIESE